jgi:hypothetical protein
MAKPSVYSAARINGTGGQTTKRGRGVGRPIGEFAQRFSEPDTREAMTW